MSVVRFRPGPPRTNKRHLRVAFLFVQLAVIDCDVDEQMRFVAGEANKTPFGYKHVSGGACQPAIALSVTTKSDCRAGEDRRHAPPNSSP